MPDKERVGRLLRTLVGLLTVAWLLVAVFVPPDPFTFLLWLVVAWVVAAIAAVWLVYLGGYATLVDSDLYAPGVPASTATGVFVVLALVLKVALTFTADLLLGEQAVGYGEGVAAGLVAVCLAYLVVFGVGVVGWLRGE